MKKSSALNDEIVPASWAATVPAASSGVARAANVDRKRARRETERMERRHLTARKVPVLRPVLVLVLVLVLVPVRGGSPAYPQAPGRGAVPVWPPPPVLIANLAASSATIFSSGSWPPKRAAAYRSVSSVKPSRAITPAPCTRRAYSCGVSLRRRGQPARASLPSVFR